MSRIPYEALFSSQQDENDDDTPISHETVNNDVRMFLSQRTIQSFMFLLTQTRDIHTLNWLDRFLKPITNRNNARSEEAVVESISGSMPTSHITNDMKLTSRLLQYHGLDALNTTKFPAWNSPFLNLLQEPDNTIVITSVHSTRKEFQIDIVPASLCTRLISVREQLAREWQRDLLVIANMGESMLRSYWENVEKERSGESSKEGERLEGFERSSTTFLDGGLDDFAPSPLRKGNFDLLMLLVTRESLHRVLKKSTAADMGGDEKSRLDFLKNFYVERFESHFWGNKRYGRADDFIEELLLSMPTMVRDNGNDAPSKEGMALVDPIKIAELVLEERENVAMEWREMMDECTQDHTEIRRLQFNRMMGLVDTVETDFQ